MPEIYYQGDCNLSLLEDETIAVVGYGNQGHTHVLSLGESGCNAVMDPYEESRFWRETKEQGFEVYTAAKATKKTDVITILINDEKQVAMYKESIASNLRPGMMLMFAHGFAIHFGQIVPPKDVDVTMIAPRVPGYTVRSEYQRSRGTPCLVAVHQDAIDKVTDMVLAYDQGIGGARAGILETTFRVETETSLFEGQAVLRGGVCILMKAGLETLVGAGYAPENACFECVHKMKLIVGLVYESGFAGTRCSISDTAEYGDYVTGLEIMTDETKKTMKKILSDIQDGTSAKDWLTESQVGCSRSDAMRGNEAAQPLEKVGSELRKLYSWSGTDKLINS